MTAGYLGGLTVSGALGGEQPLSEALADEAWDAVFDRMDGWIGGDAVYSTPLPGGDILWLFADTYIGQVRDHRRLPGTRMVNNTLARHARPAPGGAVDPRLVQFLWGPDDDQRHPTAWIQPTAEPADGPQAARAWYWLADALVIPSHPSPKLIVFLWRIERAGQGALGFRSIGSAMAIVDNPQADWHQWQPRQVNVVHSIPSSAHDARQSPQIAWGSELIFLPDEAGALQLLVFGYRQPAAGPTQIILARVPAGAVEQMERWEFKTRGGWSAKLGDAAPVASNVTTEFSVSRVEHLGGASWVLIHSEPFFGDRILARTADYPFGPWSPATAVYRVAPLDRQKKHFTYAAKAHPELSAPGELLVSYVVNSLDFGESSSNANIYRPRFVRVPLSLLPEPPSGP